MTGRTPILRVLLGLALSAAIAVPATAAPLVGKNLYVPYLGHLTLPVPGPALLGQGAYRVTTRHYYLNDFRPFLDVSEEELERGAEAATNVDYESYAGEAGVVLGLSPRVELGVGASWHALYGGVLDSTIERFHGVFGLPNSYRHYFARDRIVIRMTDGSGVSREVSDPVFGLSGVDLSAHAGLIDGRRATLTATGALRIPLPDPTGIVSAGSVDLGAGITGHLALGTRVRSVLSLGVVAPLERPDERGFPRPMLNSLLGVSFAATNRLDVVTELRVATAPYYLDRMYGHPLFGVLPMYTLPQTNLIVGFERRFDAGTLTFYVEEDFLTWEGADVVLALGWSSAPR